MSFSKRERNIIAVCAALVFIALLHLLVVGPTLRMRADLDDSISKARKQLRDLKLLKREYDQILAETKNIRTRMDGRSRDFALSVSFIEQTAAKLSIDGNLMGMTPSRRNLDSNLVEDMFAVTFEGISVENLVAYLYEIERTGAAIAVSNITVAPESRLGGGLKVSMLVTSIGSP